LKPSRILAESPPAPWGCPFPVLERLADILRRYDEDSLVAQAIRQAQGALAQVIERMQQGDPKV
jgi:hypothetical protein